MSGDITLVVLLILFSAAFAISEISIAAARKIKLQVLADEGDERAAAVLALQAQPGAFFAMIQIALNAIAILGGIVGEESLTPYFKQMLALFLEGKTLDQASFTLSFVTITSAFILFADLLPKRLGMILPEVVAVRVVYPMRWVTLTLSPLVMLFNGIANLVLKLLRVPTQREETVTPDDIVAMMEAGAQHGSIQQQEYQLIENVFELEGRMITSAMTTREQIVFFDIHDTLEDVSTEIIEHPHNWFLVCDGSLDKIVGAIQSKEILRRVLKGDSSNFNTQHLQTELLYLPDTLTLTEGLDAFKQASSPFAVVLNEYALVVGVITVKDLMNSFMGDLVSQVGDEQIVQRDTNSWLVDGTTPLVDLARLLDLEVAEFPNHSQYETAAGLLIYQLKRIPKAADSITLGDFKIEAVDIDNLRVDQLMVSRIDPNREAE